MFTGETTNLTRIWRIKPQARPMLYFTESDTHVTLDGNRYVATKSFDASAVQSTTGGDASDMELVILLGGDFTYLDVTRGVYDNALVELEVIDLNDHDKRHVFFSGTAEQVIAPNDMVANLSLRGHAHKLHHTLNETYTPYCRARFGDHRCKVDVEQYAIGVTVVEVVSARRFKLDAGMVAGAYGQGSLVWLTGTNQGHASDVMGNTADHVDLLIKPKFEPMPGDTARLYQGCPKTLAACRGFNNIANFRGEPHAGDTIG